MRWIKEKVPIRFSTRLMLAVFTLICVVVGLQVRVEQNLRQHISRFFVVENKVRDFENPGKLVSLKPVKVEMENGLVDYLLFRREFTLVYEAGFTRNRILYTHNDRFRCETNYLAGIGDVVENGHKQSAISFG